MNVRNLVFPLLSRARRHPATRRSARARRGAVRALGAGVVTFVAVQVALAVASVTTHWIADPMFADKKHRLESAERVPPPDATRVLLLGTSRAGNGFDAGRVQSATAAAGVPAVAFNFGIPGAGPVTHLVYLRRLLADGHRPNLLVIEVLPALLSDTPGGPIEKRGLTGDRLTHGEAELVARYGFPAGRLERQWWAATLLPVHAHRFKLISRVAADALPWQYRFHGGRDTDPHGWHPSFVDQVTDEERARRVADVADEYREAVTHEIPAGPAVAALRELLTLCRNERLPVALVLFPEGTTFRAMYAPDVELRLQRFLAELRTEFRCPITDAREWAADDRFGDGHHLLRPGAEAFTDRLIRDMLVPLLKSQAPAGRRE